MFSETIKIAVLLVCFQFTIGGYAPASYYPYPSFYPTFVQRPVFQQTFVRPVTTIQVPQKRPLQLRPPSQAPVALPNTRPPVVAIHAERPQQQQPSQAVSVPVSNQGIPVVAIQAQQQQIQNVPTRPAYPSQGVPVVAIHAQQQQNQIQTIPVSVSRPQQPVVAIQAQVPARKIVLPLPAVVNPAPSYSFGYAVKDLTTGDEKSHHETRTGDNVVGEYSVVEPDGTLRVVRYTAGPNGYNAVVERTPGYAPPNAPVKVVAVSKPVAVAPAVISKPIAVASRPVGLNPFPVYPNGFHFGG